MKNVFYKIVIFIFLLIALCGCAKKDPVDTVVDHHVDHINAVLDYATNNIYQTDDVKFLINELDSCKLAIVDVKQVYYGQMSACNAEKDKWRITTLFLGLALLGAVLLKLKRLF